MTYDPFDRFDRQFDKSAKRGVATVAGLGCLVALFNIVLYSAMFAGGVYFIFWCLQHFNVI